MSNNSIYNKYTDTIYHLDLQSKDYHTLMQLLNEVRLTLDDNFHFYQNSPDYLELIDNALMVTEEKLDFKKGNFVYSFWYGDEPIYVGSTTNLYARTISHLSRTRGNIKEEEMFSDSTVYYISFDSKEEMIKYEKYYIKKLKPIFNKNDLVNDIEIPTTQLKGWQIYYYDKK